MSLVKTLYKTFLYALFPISSAEQELFSLSPEDAYGRLQPAPSYEGLAVTLSNTHSVFAYKDERVVKLIWNIKYKRSAYAAKIGGYVLWQELCNLKNFSTTEPRIDVPNLLIVPMPITPRRRRERGYNQCELLLDEIEKSACKESSPFIFEKKLLVRTHHISRQTLKGRKERVRSAQGIFAVEQKIVEKLQTKLFNDLSETNIKKMPVIIIDDVITTGSTMHEAIQTLKKAGFEDVRGLSLAH